VSLTTTTGCGLTSGATTIFLEHEITNVINVTKNIL
jgi:hypothetical protein